MKKSLVFSAVALTLAASSAFAQHTFCNRPSVAQQGTVPTSIYGTPGTHFMQSAPSIKCSANVQLLGIDGTAAAWYSLAGNSNKGNTTYGASTGGFTIQTGCAIKGGCTAAEVTTALNASNRGT